jgi:hypothetical protein
MNFTGWWLDSNSGKVIQVREHGSAIIENPAKFGFSKKEIADILDNNPYNTQATGKKDSRTMLLKAAFEKGWVRVRQVGSSYTFEFSGRAKTVVKRIIKKFGDDFGPFTQIRLHDLGSNQNWSLSYQDMVEKLQDGEFDDSIATVQLVKPNEMPADILSAANRDTNVRNILRKSIEPEFGTMPNAGTFESRIYEALRRIFFK